MNAPGVSNTATLNVLLKSVGLVYSDVTTANMPLPDHVAALGNKAVDAAASVEPAPTIAIRNKFAVLLKGDDEIIPNHQIAVLLYSEKFAKNTDAGNRFMRAYIRAVRFYNGALQDGRMIGPNADKVIEILAASTPIKDPAIYKAITPTGMNPDGHVNIKSLADDLDFYKSQGLITGDIRVADVVDNSFVEAAVKELGPYKRRSSNEADGDKGTFGWRKRIGYIGPTVMEVVPYEFYRYAPDGIGLVGVTCNIDDWSAEYFDKALAQVTTAAAYLGSRGVDFIIHGGGPLVVARGKGYEQVVVNDIETAAGVRATTGVRAAIDSLRHIGAQRVAIASPYPARHNVQ